MSPTREKTMTDRTREQQAEDALPQGVARGRSLNTPSEELQLRAGGVGPGGQIGPDPNTRRLQEGPSLSREPDGDLPQGPISGDPRTPVPTTAKGQDIDDQDQG
jgi:hypothetical protein